MDDTGVSANQVAPAADSLAGAGPLVEQTVRSVLEQHVASLTRKALDRRAGGLLDSAEIEQLALEGGGAAAG